MTAFQFPPEVLAQHIAVLGKTGSGKTSTAKLCVEQVVDAAPATAAARVCILDPIKSDWWGLVSRADGKRAGLPFHILGGPRGHVPLHSGAGKAIGELVATGALPLSIIDMADFEPGGQARFFGDFAPVLLRKMRGVLHLVIEEAHLFAPKERSGIGAESMSIHWAKMLATAGRSKGIRLIVATQRTQALHNAILGSCDTLIAHRLTSPADKAPVLTWLKDNADPETREKVASSLSGLRTGSGWICSGEAQLFQLVAFPRIRTFDNTSTPTAGSEQIEVQTAPVDQEKLRAVIGAAVQEAEENDPKLLQKRIAELQRQLAAKAPAAVAGVPEAEVQRRIQEAVASADLAGVAAEREASRRELEKLSVPLATIRDLASQALSAGFEAMNREVAPARATVAQPVRQQHTTAAPAPRQREVVPAAGLSMPQQRLLDALAWWAAAGVEAPTRHQVAFVAGYTVGGNFNNLASDLRTRGLIDYPAGGALGLLPPGRAAAHAPDAQPTRASLVARVLGVLKGEPQRRIFQALVDAGAPLSREDLAANCGYAVGGNFNNLCSALKGIGVAAYPFQGSIGLADIFTGLR